MSRTCPEKTRRSKRVVGMIITWQGSHTRPVSGRHAAAPPHSPRRCAGSADPSRSPRKVFPAPGPFVLCAQGIIIIVLVMTQQLFPNHSRTDDELATAFSFCRHPAPVYTAAISALLSPVSPDSAPPDGDHCAIGHAPLFDCPSGHRAMRDALVIEIPALPTFAQTAPRCTVLLHLGCTKNRKPLTRHGQGM